MVRDGPARRGESTRAAPSSAAVWKSCPQACITPEISLEKDRPGASWIRSASMSARRATVFPGRPPRNPEIIIEDPPTPLAIDVEINHTGDCFD